VKRIRRLLYPKRPQGAWAPLVAAVGLMVSVAMVLAAWQAAPAMQGAGTPKTGGQRTDDTPYLRWLNEDVAYIVSDDERAVFQRLPTDEEREKFIEQFWLRRDPTPRTAANEFKEEHYRRIKYSGLRFPTASGRPGWQTDRGRIYIVYGPPDEIESHPSGAPHKPYPFEIWLYRHVEGIGNNVALTFIDRTKSQDYQIAPMVLENYPRR
jgi:GWxTD domain-containing protein